jgi:hypothetical protein
MRWTPFLRNGAIGAALAAGLFLAGCAEKPADRTAADPNGTAAADDHYHPPGTPADHSHDAPASGHSHEEDTRPVPTTLDGIWAEVEVQRGELAEAIAANRLDGIYAIGVRIRNLVAAMPPLSGQYVATREGPLEDAVKRVGEISDLLHEAADAQNSMAAANQKTRLDTVLDYIKGLYPAGVLAGS